MKRFLRRINVTAWNQRAATFYLLPRCSRVGDMHKGGSDQLVSSSSPRHRKEKSESQESKRRYSNKVSTCRKNLRHWRSKRYFLSTSPMTVWNKKASRFKLSSRAERYCCRVQSYVRDDSLWSSGYFGDEGIFVNDLPR